MHEPANMPEDVICHVEEMKQESTVYQFQSIYYLVSCFLDGPGWSRTEILQLPPIPSIELMSIPVAEAPAAVPVAVGVVVMVMPIEWSILVLL